MQADNVQFQPDKAPSREAIQQEKREEVRSRKKAIHFAVKKTREQLTSHSGIALSFDRDLALAHARNYRAIGLLIPILIFLVGFIGLNWNPSVFTIGWMALALSVHALVLLQNRRYIKLNEKGSLDHKKWQQRLVTLNFLSGIVWAAYLLNPIDLQNQTQTTFIFASFVIVLAIYAFTTAPILNAMVSATAPITLMILASFVAKQTMTHMFLGAFFMIAQILFIFFARHIQGTLVSVLLIQSEKDNLILDLEEAKSQSEESQRRAEAANLAKSRFLATMSHELRTPLNAILGFSEIMQQEVLGPLDNKSYKEYVGDIHSSGKHLLNLINEILDLSRIEAGKYELSESSVSLIDVVEDCQALMQLRAQNKDIEIRLLSEKRMPRIWADERAIRQIVLNLLSNAVKFTPQGGGITVSAGWTSGGGQYVSVTDTGPGVPENEIPIILSQFGQGSLAIKSAEQGTGLGLPIVQALINMHNGTFEFKSKLRVGTRVTVSIPNERVIMALAPMRDGRKDSVHSTVHRQRA